MSISYDVFTSSFLFKITEYKLPSLNISERTFIVDEYMHKAISKFKSVCDYDLTSTKNDIERTFTAEISAEDIDEIVDVVSEGMIVQWLKPYIFNQDLLENNLNTHDFTQYSPAELILRVNEVYSQAKKNYTNMIREYSYSHGDLTSLHI